MRYCPACGAANDESADFCHKCGKRKPDGEAAAAPETKGDSTPPHGAPGGAPPLPVLPQPPPYPPRGFPGGFPQGFGSHPQGVPPGPPVYAGFWIRLVAITIDALIVGFFFSWPIRFSGVGGDAIAVFASLMYLGAFFTYLILMTGHFGQTLGKMALRLKVVKQDMTPMDYGVASAREFSMILSALILYIGFIMAGFDSRKRALHDRIAKTYVLRY